MFVDRVCSIVRKIPFGKTMSYGEVAIAAGSPGAYRAVGNVMKNNHDPEIPCHRVVRSDGTPGGYNQGSAEKVRKLKEEGVIMSQARVERR
jgi:O-6-methylguanine DNA methyltransferase